MTYDHVTPGVVLDIALLWRAVRSQDPLALEVVYAGRCLSLGSMSILVCSTEMIWVMDCYCISFYCKNAIAEMVIFPIM